MKRAKVLKSWSKHNVPDDLWPEILSRLPVKSLLRFRCVSRLWKTCIDDPDFTRLHLNRFNTRSHHSQLLFVFLRGQCVVKNSQTLKTTFSITQNDPQLPHVLISTSISGFSGLNWWSICSSFDGLFLLHCRPDIPDLMLWNPSIKKMLPLPPLPEIPLLDAQHENDDDNVGFGLGFDPLIKDYKAVKIVSLKKEDVHFAAVYTLRTNSWKLTECRVQGRKDLAFHCWQSSISINGVLYGLARNHQTFHMNLVSFDLRTEVFASFELPVTNLTCRYYLSLIDDGSSIALIRLSPYAVSIWALEGLGDDTKAMSWIQRYSLDVDRPSDFYDHEFLCIKKNGELLMKCKNRVECFNFETEEHKILMKRNTKRFGYPNMFTYKESLIMHS